MSLHSLLHRDVVGLEVNSRRRDVLEVLRFELVVEVWRVILVLWSQKQLASIFRM